MTLDVHDTDDGYEPPSPWWLSGTPLESEHHRLMRRRPATDSVGGDDLSQLTDGERALARAAVDGDALAIDVADESPGDLDIRCIGAGGHELSHVRGRSARCPLVAGSYVRATVTDGSGHEAWVQPMWRP